ncbi:MAG: hypothetical protein R3A10_00550 [Caldilineaceae bacterium]
MKTSNADRPGGPASCCSTARTQRRHPSPHHEEGDDGRHSRKQGHHTQPGQQRGRLWFDGQEMPAHEGE